MSMPCNSLKDKAMELNNFGHSKYLQVEFDAAFHLYSEAIKMDDTLAVAYYNRGTVLYRLGSFEEAKIDFEKAVYLDSANKEFLLGLEACQKGLSKC